MRIRLKARFVALVAALGVVMVGVPAVVSASPLVAPTNLTITSTDTDLEMTWDYPGDIQEVVHFRIEAFLDWGSGTPTWDEVTTVPATGPLAHTGPRDQTPHDSVVLIRVVPVGPNNTDGPPSDDGDFILPTMVAPTNLASSLTYNDIILTWDYSGPEPGLAGFVVEFFGSPDGVLPLDWYEVPDLTIDPSAREHRFPRTSETPNENKVRITAKDEFEVLGPTSGELTVTVPTLPPKFAAATPTELYSHAERQSMGLDYWIDGPVGVVPSTTGESWIVASNGHGPSPYKGRTAITEWPSGQGATDWEADDDVLVTDLAVEELLVDGLYAAGGGIIVDEASGLTFMIYHHEREVPDDESPGFNKFYAALGIAVWEPDFELGPAQGRFRDLGLVIEPDVSYSYWLNNPNRDFAEVGGGAFIERNGNLYLYFTDFDDEGEGLGGVSVARGAISDLVDAAEVVDDPGYQPPTFSKYDGGAFTEPGLGGESDPVHLEGNGAGFVDIARDDCRDDYVMTYAVYGSTNVSETRAVTSTDGITWSSPDQLIPPGPADLTYGPPERLYNSIIGPDLSDPKSYDGATFTVITSEAVDTNDRWDDARIISTEITRSESLTEPCVTAAPAAPSAPTITVGVSDITATWSHDPSPSPATDYRLEYAFDTGGTLDWQPVDQSQFTEPTHTTTLAFPRPPLEESLSLRARVVAINAAGQESSPSADTPYTIPANIP